MHQNVHSIFFSHSFSLCAGEQSHRGGSLPKLLNDIQVLATRLRSTSPLSLSLSRCTPQISLRERLQLSFSQDEDMTLDTMTQFEPANQRFCHAAHTNVAMPLMPLGALGNAANQ